MAATTATTANGAIRTSALLRAELLEGRYSQRLYAVNRSLDIGHLRVLWPSLLPPGALRKAVLCGSLQARRKAPALPDMPALFVEGRLLNGNAIWVHQPARRLPSASPSHSWVEVTHCFHLSPVHYRRTPLWVLHAPGSAVWINVGRTVHVPSTGPQQRVAPLLRAALHADFHTAAGRANVRSLLLNLSDGADGLPDTVQFPLYRRPAVHGQRFTDIVMLSWGRQMRYLAEDIDQLRCGPRSHLRRCMPNEPALQMVDSSCVEPPDDAQLASWDCANGSGYRDFLAGGVAQLRARGVAFEHAIEQPDHLGVLSSQHKAAIDAQLRSHAPRPDCARGGAVVTAPIFLTDVKDLSELGRRAPPYGFAGSTTSEIAQLVETSTRPARRHFHTCSVVGNSGVLLRERHGAQIDRADAVIRVNNAVRTRELERHAGTRTTWHVTSSAFMHLARQAPRQTMDGGQAASVVHFLPICETLDRRTACFYELFRSLNASHATEGSVEGRAGERSEGRAGERSEGRLYEQERGRQQQAQESHPPMSADGSVDGLSGRSVRAIRNASAGGEALPPSPPTLHSHPPVGTSISHASMTTGEPRLAQLPHVHPLSPTFYHAVWERMVDGASRIPSTGMLAVAIALRSCARIRVYGFGNGNADGNRSAAATERSCAYYFDCHNGRASPRAAVSTDAQYFSRFTKENWRHHNFRVQVAVLRCWHRAGRIALVGSHWQ